MSAVTLDSRFRRPYISRELNFAWLRAQQPRSQRYSQLANQSEVDGRRAVMVLLIDLDDLFEHPA